MKGEEEKEKNIVEGGFWRKRRRGGEVMNARARNTGKKAKDFLLFSLSLVTESREGKMKTAGKRKRRRKRGFLVWFGGS